MWEKVGNVSRGWPKTFGGVPHQFPPLGRETVFEGTTLVKLDSKGRLAIPARYREAFVVSGIDALTFTRHPDGCLLIYPPEAWEKKRKALAALPFSARALQRLVLGSAETVTPDAAGRLLVPSSLRVLASLEREAVLIGLGEHFELWDLQTYKAAEAQAMAEGFDDVDFVF